MPYNNIMSYYPENMYTSTSLSSDLVRQPGPPRPRPPMGPGPGNRPFGGGFLLPFALGFATSPLVLGPPRPRPYYGPYYGPGPYGPYPYY